MFYTVIIIASFLKIKRRSKMFYSKTDAEDINKLFADFYNKSSDKLFVFKKFKPFTRASLETILRQEGFHVLALISEKEESLGHIIGFGTLMIYSDLAGKRGIIKDVIVSKDFRKKGFEQKIIQSLIEFCKTKNVSCVDIEIDLDACKIERISFPLLFGPQKENCYTMHL